ncbi:hypothetical protein BJ138DRAFT_1104037 [Hygrophoropsis aurantiaca]|uniref:Uncharacterized protein n=1 Tax=Hygrophoropsis aurantiaca TaxID=72124 RepID=A0ACB8A2Z3_9AGAM|nr:hypothetical protein BJ138DRAFT_1104037 [Hygrophoropsis aurantiaca]
MLSDPPRDIADDNRITHPSLSAFPLSPLNFALNSGRQLTNSSPVEMDLSACGTREAVCVGRKSRRGELGEDGWVVSAGVNSSVGGECETISEPVVFGGLAVFSYEALGAVGELCYSGADSTSELGQGYLPHSPSEEEDRCFVFWWINGACIESYAHSRSTLRMLVSSYVDFPPRMVIGYYYSYVCIRAGVSVLITSGPQAIVCLPSYTAIIAVLGELMLVHSAPGSFEQAFGWFDTRVERVLFRVFVMHGANTKVTSDQPEPASHDHDKSHKEPAINRSCQTPAAKQSEACSDMQ